MTTRQVVAPECVPADEVQRRVEAVRRRAAQDGLSGVLAFADCWRSANVRYFGQFRPVDGVADTAMALLLVGDGCVDFARADSPFRVETFASVERELGTHTAASGRRPLGLAGAGLIPAALRDRCVAALGEPDRLVPTSALASEKARKSEWELSQLREAARLTDLAMATLRTQLDEHGPLSERDLARAADEAMIANGADGVAYLSMVQTGPRSGYSLALPTDRVVRTGELVLTDIGARFGNYVADGGRGFMYGAPSPRQRDIVEAAADTVEVGLSLARPGITAAELNNAMQHVLVERGFSEFSGEAKGRGTGHGTGMDPEEELPWIGPGNDTVLEPDMVFTLKATINVPEVGGLRTERIVRLTSDGVETLDEFPMRNYW